MTIDTIDGDFENALSLSQWLESDEAGKLQSDLEERIMNFLFSQDPSSPAFQSIVSQLAWIGSRPEAKPLLEREILALNSNSLSVEQCGFWKKFSKTSCKVGSFIAAHPLEIAAGAAICATGIGLAYVTGYALSVAVGGVVIAGAGSIFTQEAKPNRRAPVIHAPSSQADFAALQHPIHPALPQLELPSSPGQLLVTSDGVWLNDQFFATNSLMQHSSIPPSLSPSTPDWKTYARYNYYSEHLTPTTYQARAENALALGYYDLAVQDLNKAIQDNPPDPLAYLQRGAALFNQKEYEASLRDYQEFVSQSDSTPSLSVSEFTLGFAKGLPTGIYESGEGVLLFLADFTTHPIQTSKQVIDSITTLVTLAKNDEWGVIAEALAPEIHELVTQWDSLSSTQRGELAGHAIGKHGADFLAPGALAKVASKSVKSAHELAAVCKNLKIAQETLVLEAAAGVGNTAKISEIIQTGQTTVALAEELGITAKEMGQLKQAGRLEETVNIRLDRLVSQTESEVLKAAIGQDSHVKMVRDYLGKSAKEIQKGINSYEKQIAVHKDKILNPTKYYPDWEKLDPRQRQALINKKWPAEINIYEEQRDVLQSILNERLSCE